MAVLFWSYSFLLLRALVNLQAAMGDVHMEILLWDLFSFFPGLLSLLVSFPISFCLISIPTQSMLNPPRSTNYSVSNLNDLS